MPQPRLAPYALLERYASALDQFAASFSRSPEEQPAPKGQRQRFLALRSAGSAGLSEGESDDLLFLESAAREANSGALSLLAGLARVAPERRQVIGELAWVKAVHPLWEETPRWARANSVQQLRVLGRALKVLNALSEYESFGVVCSLKRQIVRHLDTNQLSACAEVLLVLAELGRAADRLTVLDMIQCHQQIEAAQTAHLASDQG